MSKANESVSETRGNRVREATFGQNLRAARRGAGISQDDLARESGVDRTAISTYERGRREPNLRTIVRLADALGIAPAELVRHL
jgi:transcriptional regulator with XRE-family HTH domain